MLNDLFKGYFLAGKAVIFSIAMAHVATSVCVCVCVCWVGGGLDACRCTLCCFLDNFFFCLVCQLLEKKISPCARDHNKL